MRKPLALLMLAISCTDAAPCTTCPQLDGVWFLQFVAPDFPCDGGTPPLPPSTVQLVREGSVVRSVIDGVQVSGTIYDSFDFTLNGQSLDGTEAISWRATYKPASRADAGDEQLVSGRLLRTISSCREDRRFTGARY